MGDTVDPLDVECQQLVLEVPDGYSHVVLARKQFGARSQLWRMTGEGQLQHEGSSPPRAPPDKILVRVLPCSYSKFRIRFCLAMQINIALYHSTLMQDSTVYFKVKSLSFLMDKSIIVVILNG